MTDKSVVAIVGNGAIGNLLALKCDLTGQPFHLITRTGTPLDISIHDLKGQSHRLKPTVYSVDTPVEADMIILPLKAYQIEEALVQLKPKISNKTTLVLLHNGMGSAEIARQHFRHNAIVAATTSYACYKKSPQQTVETGSGTTEAGWVQRSIWCSADTVQRILRRLLPPLTWHDDVNVPLWNKLCVNAVINPLSAIHQINNGKLAAPRFDTLIAALCCETAQVMHRCGVPSNPVELEKNVRLVIQRTAENYSSMNRDVASKKPTEIDFINGYIVSKAKQFGIDVPNHETLLKQINAIA